MKDFSLRTITKPMAMLSGAAVMIVGLSTSAVAQTRDIIVPTITITPATVSQPKVRRIAQVNDTALAREAHAQINRYRTKRGLPALKWSSAIAAEARKHSEAMAQGRTAFGHTGFSKRVKQLQMPFRSAAENVAYNQGYRNPVNVAVKGWLKSPGHKNNIEGKFDQAGIGVARNAKGEVYFTQVFLRSR